ncbi:MAG: thioredoxin-disulfide reductase [candidate division FCPU426 bacterium]
MSDPAAGIDILIIGGGPAGLAAGLYAVRTGRSVLLLEQFVPGGQVGNTWQVDNYPGLAHISGPDLMQKMESQVRDLGLTIETSPVTGVTPGPIHTVHTPAKDYSARTVILAVGAVPKPLGIPGEQEYRGRGVSYCGTCDGPFFRQQPVAVIGGGNTALEEAEFLTRFASKVYLVHRRPQFRADHIVQEHVLKNPKIEIVTPYVPQEVLGKEQGVTGLRISHREQPECRDLEVKGVFVFVGWTPQTEAFRKTVDCDDEGYIRTDQTFGTSVPGIFAAGDCRANLLKQIVVAAGEGATAAVMADRFLATHAAPARK